MKQRVKRWVGRVGYGIHRLSADDRRALLGHDDSWIPPQATLNYLSPSNERLRQLEDRYATVHSPATTHSQWKTELSSSAKDLRFFRGDNAYLWQYPSYGEAKRLRYFLYAQYISDRDTRKLLGSILKEDGSYGCLTYEYPSLPRVSRDLLDSVNELYFLDRHLDLLNKQNLRILDIGAGYGRLAQRMLSATPGVLEYVCCDAIARSTFLSEFFLAEQDERIASRARVVPLDEVASSVLPGTIDLAVNVHSFSEMSYVAVAFWLGWLKSLAVPWLFIVPNEASLLSREADGTRRDCSELLKSNGYQLAVRERTFLDDNVRELFGVEDYFLLYQLVPGSTPPS